MLLPKFPGKYHEQDTDLLIFRCLVFHFFTFHIIILRRLCILEESNFEVQLVEMKLSDKYNVKFDVSSKLGSSSLKLVAGFVG